MRKQILVRYQTIEAVFGGEDGIQREVVFGGEEGNQIEGHLVDLDK